MCGLRISKYLLFIVRFGSSICIHPIFSLSFVNPQFRLLHNRAQLVQVWLDLLVVVHILTCHQQLDLMWMQNGDLYHLKTSPIWNWQLRKHKDLLVWRPWGPPASGWSVWKEGAGLQTPEEGNHAWSDATEPVGRYGLHGRPSLEGCSLRLEGSRAEVR